MRFRTILRSCLDQIAANRDATLALDDPEGPHQMRVGLRRLRSALKIHAKHLPDGSVKAIDTRAQALATQVGVLRDLDVLAGEIVASASESAPAGIGLDRLGATVLAARADARTALRARLLDPGVNALIFDIGALAEGALLDEATHDGDDGGNAALADTRDRLRRAGAGKALEGGGAARRAARRPVAGGAARHAQGAEEAALCAGVLQFPLQAQDRQAVPVDG
jgi:CHAD domain-containing protein